MCLSISVKVWPLFLSLGKEVKLSGVACVLNVCVCVQEHTRVGADTSQDIQLFGIGIQPEHCVIDISPDGDVTLCPVENARSGQ